MTSTVYAVKGGFEDWAYGGWDKPNVPFCKPTTLPAYSLVNVPYADEMLRSFVYLVESSTVKNPATKTLGNWNDVTHTGSHTDGHVSRNIRMSLDLIRIAQPYVIFENMKFNAKRREVIVTYKAGGCFKITDTKVLLNTNSKRLIQKSSPSATTGVIISNSGKGYMTDPKAFVTARFKVFDISKPVGFKISLSCDQNWGSPPPGITLTPQTHLVRMRTTDFTKPITNNGYSLESKKSVSYNVPNFVPNMLKSYKFDLSERDD